MFLWEYSVVDRKGSRIVVIINVEVVIDSVAGGIDAGATAYKDKVKVSVSGEDFGFIIVANVIVVVNFFMEGEEDKQEE